MFREEGLCFRVSYPADFFGKEKTRRKRRGNRPENGIKIETTKYNAYEVHCPVCGAVSRGAFPEPVNGTRQYGPRLRAYMVMLLQYGMVGMKRLGIIMQSLFGVNISEGTIAATV
jgi:hypothetical protein